MTEYDIDEEVVRGVLGREGLARLQSAEDYGSASPMNWLGQRLRHLESVVAAGRRVRVDTADGPILLETSADFHAWCRRTFPDAYGWFFKSA